MNGETKIYPVFAGDVPKCSSPDLHRVWKAGADMIRRSSFCEDCTPDYKAQMIRERRCENPRVQFRRDSDGMVEGFIPPRSKAEVLAA